MTDEEVGRKIAAALRNRFDAHFFTPAAMELMGETARALLAKPVATREVPTRNTIHRFIGEFGDKEGWDGRQLNDGHVVDAVIAALSHFAQPASNAPILRMQVHEIEKEMTLRTGLVPLDILNKREILQWCAEQAHRLAQPVPEVDPDAGAKRLARSRRSAEGARMMWWAAFDAGLSITAALLSLADIPPAASKVLMFVSGSMVVFALNDLRVAAQKERGE